MDAEWQTLLSGQFAQVDDPRVERTKLHRLLDILGIALCVVLEGASSSSRRFASEYMPWSVTCLRT